MNPSFGVGMQPIPGSDPGACPDCGTWMKAGLVHECVARSMSIDPVCVFHGKRWSEHEGGRCLYCCLCFRTLTVEECHVQSDGQKIDMCDECATLEQQMRERMSA